MYVLGAEPRFSGKAVSVPKHCGISTAPWPDHYLQSLGEIHCEQLQQLKQLTSRSLVVWKRRLEWSRWLDVRSMDRYATLRFLLFEESCVV